MLTLGCLCDVSFVRESHIFKLTHMYFDFRQLWLYRDDLLMRSWETPPHWIRWEVLITWLMKLLCWHCEHTTLLELTWASYSKQGNKTPDFAKFLEKGTPLSDRQKGLPVVIDLAERWLVYGCSLLRDVGFQAVREDVGKSSRAQRGRGRVWARVCEGQSHIYIGG